MDTSIQCNPAYRKSNLIRVFAMLNQFLPKISRHDFRIRYSLGTDMQLSPDNR